MLRRLAAFIAAIGISAFAVPATAQLSRPISGATSAPHCTSAELASRTGACAALTPKGDEVAVVTNASATSNDLCGTSGATGALQVVCQYSEVSLQWEPWVGDTWPSNINAASHRLDNLSGLDFTFGCTAFANGGKTTLDAAGNLVCQDDVSSSAGSGHQIQNNGASLPGEVNLNFELGGDSVASDDGANGATKVSIPAYTRRAVVTNFNAMITCPTPIPQVASGTIARCRARATTFGGIPFTNGSFVELEGTYDMVSPNTTTGGFKVVSATFGDGGACALNSANCGDQLKTFVNNLRTLATNYNGGKKPVIKFLPTTYYNFDGVHPGVIKGAGWTLDATANPTFGASNNNMSASSIALAGTGSVVAAPVGNGTCTAGNSNSRCLVMTGSSFCGGGTCYDGDEQIKAGDVLKLGSATWDAAGVGNNELVIVTGIVDSTHITFEPPLTGDVTNVAVAAGTAKILEFDNVSTTTAGLPLDNPAQNVILGEITIGCEGLCKSFNPNIPAQNDPNQRTVPLQMVVVRHVAQSNPFITGACGKNDAGFTTTFSTVSPTLSSSSGQFKGALGGCTDWAGAGYQLHGSDPNSMLHGGVGSAVRQLSADFSYEPKALGYNYGRFMFAASNCSVSHYNMRRVENAAQLAWMPSGCDEMEFTGVDDEQFAGCNDGVNFPLQPVCDLAAARPAWVHLGKRHPSSANPYVFRFNFANMFFWQRPLTFLKVDETDDVRVEVNGMVGDPSALFDIASNNTTVVGNVNCYVGDSPVPTACDRPATGNFQSLFVSDENGFKWTGRRLDQMDPNVPLPLGSLTDDDAVADRCLVSGGAGNPPRYIACPGGAASTLDGLSDVTAPTPGTNDLIRWSGSAWVNVAPSMRTAPNTYVMPNLDTLGIGIGSATSDPNSGDADILLNANGSAVFNVQAASQNFRVGALGDPNTLVVVGSTARVGVGTNAPGTKLAVNGTTTSTAFSASSTNAQQYAMTGQTGTDPTCSAGAFWFFADADTNKIRKCENGTASDVGSGSGSVTSITADTGGSTVGSPVSLLGSANGIDTTRSGDTVTISIDSQESGFLSDMGASSTLSCSAGTQGRTGVLDGGDLLYCDGASTALPQTVLHKATATSFTTRQLLVASTTGTGGDVVSSAATLSNTADLTVPGQVIINADTDAIQFDLTANATQTNSVMRIRNSALASLMTLDNSGNLTVAGSMTSADQADGFNQLNMMSNSSVIQAGTPANHCSLGFVAGVLTKYCNGGSQTSVEAGSPSFTNVTTGVNTASTMTVSSGASLVFNTTTSGTGYMIGTDTIAGSPALAANAITVGTTGFIFEGSSGGADANETLLTVANPTGDRTLTLPDATDTLVGKDTTDILTNKTLTSPVIGTKVNMPSVTALPGGPATGDVVVVTDDPTVGACTSAGGSAVTVCRWSGAAWAALGDGVGGAGSPPFTNITSGTNTTANMTIDTGAALIFNTTTSGSGGMTGTATVAGDPTLAANAITVGTTGLIFEGTTANGAEGRLSPGDPSVDRAWTFPDNDGSIVLATAGTFVITGAGAGEVMTVPNASFTVARTDAANSFTGTQTVTQIDVTNADTSLTRTGAGVVAVEGLNLPRIVAKGTIALNTTAVTNGTCGTVQDGGTATGVLTTDVVQWSFNGDVSGVTGYNPAASPGLQIMAYPTADHFNVKICNPTAGSITPGSAVTLNWMVLR